MNHVLIDFSDPSEAGDVKFNKKWLQRSYIVYRQCGSNPGCRTVAAKYTVVDGATGVLTHLTEVLLPRINPLLIMARNRELLNRVRDKQASLVEELIPAVLTVSDVQRVYKVFCEKVSIRY